MATSFCKLYPRVAHQRVSQLGRANSFSKFYPCIAHIKGWVNLERPLPSLNFILGLLTKGWVNLEGQHPSLSFTPAWPQKGEPSWNGHFLL